MARSKPTIENRQIVARSRFFRIESVDLTFSNGATRTYERMPGGEGAVLVIALDDDNNLLLVREYAVGTESYELGFPKGRIDPGEEAVLAADRELKEEIGYGCERLTHIRDICTAPSYFGGHMAIYLAEQLYPAKLEGDEPEPLELVRWPLERARELLSEADFREGRSLCALLLLLEHLRD